MLEVDDYGRNALDFIETYNSFDSENNEEDYPHLCLSYMSRSSEGTRSTPLSNFGSEELGQLFKEIARSEEMRSLVASTIGRLAARQQEPGKAADPDQGTA